ncbi:MAG: CBS domain-containing protein [Sphaerobacter sp.]|nr:CBS domain-containing protein [Sphaerobacter sp.]
MVDELRVADVIVEEVGTIRPDEPVRTARRRMEAQTRRSLIVVDEDRPIGVVQWRDIMRQEELPADAPVGDYMIREFPVLRADASLREARAQLGDVDVDRLPVVDASGHLIGEVPRTALVQAGEVRESAPAAEHGASTGGWSGADQAMAGGADQAGAAAGQGTARSGALARIEAGMAVKGINGRKLGTVNDVVVDPQGELSAITVRHGLFGRKHKRIPADTIDHVEGDAVFLSITGTEFNVLPDVEDEA